jgi:hypothetical protein
MPPTTDDVYGITRDLPLNYVEREAVDHRLLENLSAQKHIVIYGSSKQGKTSLRKHCLAEDDYIVVQCSNKWNLATLHEAILKRAGFTVTQSTTRTTSGTLKLTAQAGIKVLGTGGEVSSEFEGDHARETTVAPMELDPSDTNDLISALASIHFSKFIVLEDFHYLPNETQRDFSVALKALHEGSKLSVIIIGVWLEENRLVVYNGDLTGRLVPIDADRWTSDELTEVVQKGADLLNIGFSERFVFRLLGESYSSVYTVQEACRRVCRSEHVFETQGAYRVVGDAADAATIVATIVDEQSARYRAFLRHFADGFQDSELRMYQWILLPVLSAVPADLQGGLTYPEIRKELQTHHPLGKSLNLGNLTIALQSAANLQVKKDIKPLILDYDDTNRRLRVVDRGFLIWLSRQRVSDLLEYVGFEQDLIDRVTGPRVPLPGDLPA